MRSSRLLLAIAVLVAFGAGAASIVLDGPASLSVAALALGACALLLLLGQKLPVAISATVTAALSGFALTRDSADLRIVFGGLATVALVVAVVLWRREWRAAGGRLLIAGVIARQLRRWWPALSLALLMVATAAAAYWDAPLIVIAILLGIIGGTILARQRHSWTVRISGGIVGTVTVLLATVDSAPLAISLLVLAWFVHGTLFLSEHSHDNRVSRKEMGSRFAKLLARILTSLILLAGALVAVALVAGRLLLASAEPISFEWLRVGAWGLAILIVAIVSWWWRSWVEIVLRQDSGYWVGILLGLIVVGWGSGALDKAEPRDPRTDDEREVAGQHAHGMFDLLLVIDPADPVGRALIRRAREEVAPSAEPAGAGDVAGPMFTPRFPDSPYDVAYGIAVPEPPSAAGPLWRVVEPPTTDARELAASLAAIEPRPGAPAAGSYGRLLAESSAQWRVGWRRRARRGVAFMLDRLPSPGELGAGGRQSAGCEGLRESPPPDGDSGDDPAAPVAWDRALADQCTLRDAFLGWLHGSLPREHPIALHAVTRDADEERRAAWRGWASELGGTLDASHAEEPLTRGVAVEMLQNAADVHTGVPVGELWDAAWRHRPVLRFDRDERLRPVDVEWLLNPDRRPAPLVQSVCEPDAPEPLPGCRTPGSVGDDQRVCDRPGLDARCVKITGRDSLASERDVIIDFAGDGPPPADSAPDPPRMYVHVRDEGDEVYLAYWWFFRYNSSPWRKEVNCLPGLSIGELSCHDHEGDWEGVSVVLDRELRPRAAVYDAHGRNIRWRWEQLELRYDRPVAYIAVGSHAAYPRACERPECDQRLGGQSIGEGGFDGKREWAFNTDEQCDADQLGSDDSPTHGPCLAPLPAIHDVLLDDRRHPTDDGHRGVLWNAYFGRWGRARCTVIGHACSQVNGPRSPSMQSRFLDPRCTRDGSTGRRSRHCPR